MLIQMLRNKIADTLAELEEGHATHVQVKDVLQAKILTLEANLARKELIM